MRTMSWQIFAQATLLFSFLTACATSPLGRSQLILVPESQMDQMGAQAFQQLKGKEPVETNSQMKEFVRCVVEPLLRVSGSQIPANQWEIVVFRNQDANAFALPGGKIGVYTGILKVAKTDAQLAAVLGHEIAHVLAHHGAERVSQQAGTQIGLAALGAVTKDNPKSNLLMGLLGVGIQVGVLLPFNRAQESESDLMGLDLMARAGFEPRESVKLWENMASSSGGKRPPEWLSTHPANETRIQTLQNHMAGAQDKYAQVHAAGTAPQCIHP